MLFFKRQNIYKAVNILFVIYVYLSAITCNYTLNKLFKKNKKINILLSIIYSISPFTIYMYQIIRWMSFPVLFPLLILSLKRLLEEEKSIGYVLIITYYAMLNVQFTFELLLFIILGVALYIFKNVKKDERKRKILVLGIYTLLALLISSVVLLPNITNILSSQRSALNDSYFNVINTKDIFNTMDLFDRIFLVFNPIFISVIIKQIINRKLNLKDNLLIMIILLTITAIYQPSNLLWHMGSYMCFPVRYSYILSFLHVLYISKYLDINKKKDKISIIDIILLLINIIIFSLILIMVFKYNKEIIEAFESFYLSYFKKETAYKIVNISILILISSILIIFIKNNKLKYVLAYLLIIISTFSNLYYGLSNTSEYNKEYESLQKQHLKQENNLTRTKINSSFNSNSSLIDRNPSLQGFLPTISKAYVKSNEEWGYGNNYIINGTNGGTIFSDNLLRIENYLDYDISFPKQLFTKENNNYRSNYIFPFGILIDSKINKYNDKEIGLLNYQKIISKEILGDNIFNIVDNDKFHIKDKNLVMNLHITTPKILYLEYESKMNYNISVNDKRIDFILTENPTIVYLGYFENEDVEIKLIPYEVESDYLHPVVATLDVEKYNELIKEYNKDLVKIKDNKITGKVVTNENKLLFIQIPNIEGWTLKVNGKKEKIINTAKGYIGLNLKKGENNIELTFIPKNLTIGIVLSIIGLLLLLIISKFKELIFSSKLKTIAYYIYLSLVFLLTLFIYIIPIIVSVFKIIF